MAVGGTHQGSCCLPACDAHIPSHLPTHPRPPAQVANLQAQLKQEAQRASLLALASDHTLAGPSLAAEVAKLVSQGLPPPHDFWERLMSERSQLIMATSNKWARERAALERRHAELQARGRALRCRACCC